MSRTTRDLLRRAGHNETFNECIERLRNDTAEQMPAVDRVAMLEDDLARALLVIHTLTEACIQRGVFTRDELNQMAAQVQMWDGAADGKLDPSVIRPQT